MKENAAGRMNRRIRKHGAFHRFYFIEPKENADIDDLAMRLIGLEPVEEVFLTEGKYGFLVKTRFSARQEPRDLASYISKNINRRFGHVVSHYAYRK